MGQIKNTPRLGFILLLLLFNLIIICAYITEIIRKSIFRLAMLGINLSPKIEEIENEKRFTFFFSFSVFFFLKYVVNINSVQNGCEFFLHQEK